MPDRGGQLLLLAEHPPAQFYGGFYLCDFCVLEAVDLPEFGNIDAAHCAKGFEPVQQFSSDINCAPTGRARPDQDGQKFRIAEGMFPVFEQFLPGAVIFRPLTDGEGILAFAVFPHSAERPGIT